MKSLSSSIPGLEICDCDPRRNLRTALSTSPAAYSGYRRVPGRRESGEEAGTETELLPMPVLPRSDNVMQTLPGATRTPPGAASSTPLDAFNAPHNEMQQRHDIHLPSPTPLATLSFFHASSLSARLPPSPCLPHFAEEPAVTLAQSSGARN
ncbi:unnamed protein product [Pleuronectes platessa]|uniref:Uncharacterized protein n=1 Tax=Pleuronectes platessa TaxID=8262 RepID=A0A9N7V1H4_PLEPL|nr:unnamed protein product [Pleuronectes platessa]